MLRALRLQLSTALDSMQSQPKYRSIQTFLLRIAFGTQIHTNA